jgi:hypothetical protein
MSNAFVGVQPTGGGIGRRLRWAVPLIGQKLPWLAGSPSLAICSYFTLTLGQGEAEGRIPPPDPLCYLLPLPVAFAAALPR